MTQKYDISTNQGMLEFLTYILEMKFKISKVDTITVLGYRLIGNDFWVDFIKYSRLKSKSELFRKSISSNEFNVYYRVIKLQYLNKLETC